LAASGNPDAVTALDHFLHSPYLHPFLREVMSGMKIFIRQVEKKSKPFTLIKKLSPLSN
jgi:hypothetical protein